MKYKTKAKPKASASGIPVFCAHDEIVDVSELKPYPGNPNKHPESQIELLGRIIRKTGWRAPITVSTLSGYIIKGHGRLEAARFEGFNQVPVEYQNFESKDEELAALVADNRISELAEMDKAMLADIFKDIDPEQIPVDLTGYNESEFKEIAGLFTGVSEQDIPEDFKEVEPETLAHKCPRCGFEFND